MKAYAANTKSAAEKGATKDYFGGAPRQRNVDSESKQQHKLRHIPAKNIEYQAQAVKRTGAVEDTSTVQSLSSHKMTNISSTGGSGAGTSSKPFL